MEKLTQDKQLEIIKAIETRLNNFKQGKLLVGDLNPFFITEDVKIFVSLDEFNNLIINSNNDKLITLFNYLKEYWNNSMFSSNDYNNIRSQIAEKKLGLFSTQEVLRDIQFIIPSSEDIDKLYNKTLKYREETRQKEWEALEKRREVWENE